MIIPNIWKNEICSKPPTRLCFFGWNIMGNYHIRRNTMIILWETNYKIILIQWGHPGISLWDTMRILYNRNVMGYPQQSMDNILRISMGISSTGYSADIIQRGYHGILLKWETLTGKIWFRSNNSKLGLPKMSDNPNLRGFVMVVGTACRLPEWAGRKEISDRVSPCIRKRKKGGQFGGLTYFHIYIYI